MAGTKILKHNGRKRVISIRKRFGNVTSWEGQKINVFKVAKGLVEAVIISKLDIRNNDIVLVVCDKGKKVASKYCQ